MESLGLFVGRDGWIHHLHPLTKMAAVLAGIFLAFSNLLLWQGVPLFPLIIALGLIVLGFTDNLQTGFLTIKRTFFVVLPFAISLVLVQGFFYPQGQTVLFEIGPFALKSEGLFFGGRILARLVLLITSTMLFLLTTHPADFTLALTQIGIPREIAYVILSALQLIPRMQAKAESITNAQKARGLVTEGNLVVRVRALIPLVGPLITSALQETEERALALEVRAFRTKGPKTSWRMLHDTTPQRIVRWLLVLSALAIFLWSLFF